MKTLNDYEVVLTLSLDKGQIHPGLWDWESLLDLAPFETVLVQRVTPNE